MSQVIPNPVTDDVLKPAMVWLLDLDCEVRQLGVGAEGWLLLSFHQPAILPADCECSSGEAEKSKLRPAGASASHGAIGSRWDGGGVCKAERAACDICEEMYADAMVSLENCEGYPLL